jgi:hypothetical protein
MDIDLNIGFDVQCDVCGATLDCKMNRTQDTLSVKPCAECMVDSYNDGYDTRGKKEE